MLRTRGRQSTHRALSSPHALQCPQRVHPHRECIHEQKPMTEVCLLRAPHASGNPQTRGRAAREKRARRRSLGRGGQREKNLHLCLAERKRHAALASSLPAASRVFSDTATDLAHATMVCSCPLAVICTSGSVYRSRNSARCIRQGNQRCLPKACPKVSPGPQSRRPRGS